MPGRLFGLKWQSVGTDRRTVVIVEPDSLPVRRAGDRGRPSHNTMPVLIGVLSILMVARIRPRRQRSVHSIRPYTYVFSNGSEEVSSLGRSVCWPVNFGRSDCLQNVPPQLILHPAHRSLECCCADWNAPCNRTSRNSSLCLEATALPLLSARLPDYLCRGSTRSPTHELRLDPLAFACGQPRWLQPVREPTDRSYPNLPQVASMGTNPVFPE